MRSSSVRIIGGKHRGRVLRIASAQRACRPSGDRTRESLFNHLGQWLGGWQCLDLFAGSGALGFEALSRGAAAVTFVERNAALSDNIRNAARALKETPTIHTMSAYRFLHHTPTPFDLVFLDPPFADYQTPAAWTRLLSRIAPWLAPHGMVYCESEIAIPAASTNAANAGKSITAAKSAASESESESTTAAPRWQTLVQKKYGQVHWHLLQADFKTAAATAAQAS